MKVNVIDRIEFNDDGSFKSVKGHVETVKVVIHHNLPNYFSNLTLRVMFWSQFNIDYCGG